MICVINNCEQECINSKRICPEHVDIFKQCYCDDENDLGRWKAWKVFSIEMGGLKDGN